MTDDKSLSNFMRWFCICEIWRAKLPSTGPENEGLHNNGDDNGEADAEALDADDVRIEDILLL